MEPSTQSLESSNQVGSEQESQGLQPVSRVNELRRLQRRRRAGLDGLSKFHRSILSRTSDRQRFVTGRYPLTVTVANDPTRKWLLRIPSNNVDSSPQSSSTFWSGKTTSSLTAAGPTSASSSPPLTGTETSILVNGTSPLRSLASLDRFSWLDDDEKHALLSQCSMVSVELISVIHLERPGYLIVLPGHGAGSTAAVLHRRQQQQRPTPLFRWKALGSGSDPADPEAASSRVATRGERLWVTGFSLAGRKGLLKAVESTTLASASWLDEADDDSGAAFDTHDGDTGRSVITSINDRTASALVWPNEVAPVPHSLVRSSPPCDEHRISHSAFTSHPVHSSNSLNADEATAKPSLSSVIPITDSYQDALLVCDGFLVPGKDRGGVYIVKNPGNPQAEWTIRLTSASDANRQHRWFYHRATWVDLTGDGRLSVLTARCRISTRLSNMEVTAGIKKTGQLVWLECPKPAAMDPVTGTFLESDGTEFDPFASRHLPWKEHVLEEGPDVMFCVADMDESDDTVEVISSQFFGKKVVLQSLRRGPRPEIVFRRVIDDDCGSAFGCTLAELDGGASLSDAPPRRAVVDSGSTVCTLKPGDAFSHLLVTSHERKYASAKELTASTRPYSSTVDASNAASESDVDGGSLFAYRVPHGKGSWKTATWHRSTMASGFQVNGQLSNMINPGAPGFVYTFHAKKSDVGSSKRPLIAVAGDCAESAYFFRPSSDSPSRVRVDDAAGRTDDAANYKPMLEIKCESTVGSIAIGYDDFSPVAQETGYAKIFVPCFEKDKILVFALGSGEEEEEDGW